MTVAQRRTMAIAMAGLWLISLFLPVFAVGRTITYGLEILWAGWMGPMVLEFSWVANPVLMLVIVALYKDRYRPQLLTVAGAILGVVFVMEATRHDYWIDEGQTGEIRARFSGFYCWIVAIGLGAALSLFAAAWPRKAGYDD